MSNNFEETTKRHGADVEKIRLAWQTQLVGLDVPDDSQLWLWLRIHAYDLQVILWGVMQTARRHTKSPMVFDHAVRYCSAACLRYRKPTIKPSLPDCKFFVVKETEQAA